ncbi:MAG: VWA domain-containing protein [Phycisphaerales bacterium]|jgi:Mg-chelatase subunit ChlD
MASVTLHLVLLTFLVTAEFSPPVVGKSQVMPTAKIEQVRQLVESPLRIPKPKVIHNHSSQAGAIQAVAFNPEQLVDAVTLEHDDFVSAGVTAADSAPIWAESAIPADSVEFFSSKSNSRRICFVVDRSGSMKGLFGRVKNELINSIETLQQDQYFGIIFFGGDKLLEFESAALVRASRGAKSRAVAFIDLVEPGGQTNAAEAFKKLSRIRDGMGQAPSTVFFLTDGFELTERNSGEFLRSVLNLLQRRLPNSAVNTIGFWPGESDCYLLRKIAAQTGGEFMRIGDKEN